MGTLDPRLLRAMRIQQRWVKDKVYQRHGETLDEFTLRCDLGEVPGLELFFELREIWDEERETVVGRVGDAGDGGDPDVVERVR